jgi:hypothetical protein
MQVPGKLLTSNCRLSSQAALISLILINVAWFQAGFIQAWGVAWAQSCYVINDGCKGIGCDQRELAHCRGQ